MQRTPLSSFLLLTLLHSVCHALDDFQVVYSGVIVAGHKLSTLQTREAPSIDAPALATTDKTLHTILMWDPDAPSPTSPTCNAWLHWIVVDATGSVCVDSMLSTQQLTIS